MTANGDAVAVLIGSGPSLSKIDIKSLVRFKSIAFNRSWLAWDEWGFDPTWYACLDGNSIGLLENDLKGVIASRRCHRWFLNNKTQLRGSSVTLVATDAQAPLAAVDKIADMGNVGATALQLLAGMGIRKILMVGIDAQYGPSSVGRDCNHFRPDYAVRDIGPADAALFRRYVAGWPKIAAVCRDWGMEVMNASPGTVLRDFPVVSLEGGIAWLEEHL